MTGRRAIRAFTLVELLVAIAILAMISMLIYSAFATMRQSKEGLTDLAGRHHEGRTALQRIARDLQSAYISLHAPYDPNKATMVTAFFGTRGSPADRIDFNSFSNTRLDKDSHESDECEISYFGSEDPDHSGVVDLARRVSPRLDAEAHRGGRVDVLATDIDLFDVEYLDPGTGQWSETWDSVETNAQPGRLPVQVRIVLVLNGGRRTEADRAKQPIHLVTKIPIYMPQALRFAL